MKYLKLLLAAVITASVVSYDFFTKHSWLFGKNHLTGEQEAFLSWLLFGIVGVLLLVFWKKDRTIAEGMLIGLGIFGLLFRLDRYAAHALAQRVRPGTDRY